MCIHFCPVDVNKTIRTKVLYTYAAVPITYILVENKRNIFIRGTTVHYMYDILILTLSMIHFEAFAYGSKGHSHAETDVQGAI